MEPSPLNKYPHKTPDPSNFVISQEPETAKGKGLVPFPDLPTAKV